MLQEISRSKAIQNSSLIFSFITKKFFIFLCIFNYFSLENLNLENNTLILTYARLKNVFILKFIIIGQ